MFFLRFALLPALLFNCAHKEQPSSGNREVVKSINDDLPLAYFDNQPIRASSLPVAKQVEIYENEKERFDTLVFIIQDEVLKRYIAREAKKTNRDEAAVTKELLEPKPLSESDLKKFYEENKEKIPYPYELIKFEVKRQAQEEAKRKLKSALLQKIAEEPGTEFALKAPVAPEVKFDASSFPALTEGNGKAELVQFLDYQCPHCREIEPKILEFAKKYGRRLRIVAVDFPLHENPASIQIAKGSYCAYKAGKYAEFRKHAMGYFDGMRAFETEFPKKIKYDAKAWKECINSKEATQHMARAAKLSDELGVTATPTFYLNKRKVPTDRLARELETLF